MKVYIFINPTDFTMHSYTTRHLYQVLQYRKLASLNHSIKLLRFYGFLSKTPQIVSERKSELRQINRISGISSYCPMLQTDANSVSVGGQVELVAKGQWYC